MNDLTRAFQLQAESCANLGSEFTSVLLRLLAERLGDDQPVGAAMHKWPGYDNFRSGAVALRLAGALNSLVLLDRDAALVAAYPPNQTDPKALWVAVDAALRRHHEHILGWIKSPPQTNEIRRCCALIPGFHVIASETGLPLEVSEIGASAGLNLNWDRYALEIGGRVWGPQDANVRLKPDWRGPLPPLADITLSGHKGCDLNPLDPANAQDRLRLMSYIWPDQSERIENTKRALDLAATTKHLVQEQDALAFLAGRLAPISGVARVVYHSIMWQYLSDDAQAEGTAMIEAAGAKATVDAPLAWLRAEADGQRGSAAIILNLWPYGETRNLGRMDFHGRWIAWNDA